MMLLPELFPSSHFAAASKTTASSQSRMESEDRTNLWGTKRIEVGRLALFVKHQTCLKKDNQFKTKSVIVADDQ